MNGPQHYKEAERLIDLSDDIYREDAPLVIAQAQVHATLAQVAALIDAADSNVDRLQWAGHEWMEATR